MIAPQTSIHICILGHDKITEIFTGDKKGQGGNIV